MKETEEKGYSSKQIILEAAMKVFAEKGFDGARVDEIAKRAKVNKALLYYYFESKDKILEALSEWQVKEMIEYKSELIKKYNVYENMDFVKNKSIKENPEMSTFVDKIFEHTKNQKDVFGILMIEALKANSSKDSFFKMAGFSLEDGIRRMKEMGVEIPEIGEFSIAAFFFALMPMISFITLGEKWAEYNQMDYKLVEEKFMELFKGVSYDHMFRETLKDKK